jgi:hypothetical protein
MAMSAGTNPPERSVRSGTVRFRIRLDAHHYVTVRVYETLREMHRASKEIHGEPCHPTEAANTICFPDVPGGCIAAMLFTWKFAPPYLIAHEASHAAVACVVKIGPGLSPDEDEPLARFNEKIFRAIYRRLHA